MDAVKLAESVMRWWKKHEFDTISVQEEEYMEQYNVFDNDPEFVVLSRQILEEAKKRKKNDTELHQPQ